MKFLESNLEDIIYDQLSTQDGCEKLRSRGLWLWKPLVFKRQLRIGNYGITDLVTLSRWQTHPDDLGKGLITIYELKKDEINLGALLQSFRYLKGIKQWIDEFKAYSSSDFVFKIVLIGSDVDTENDWVYLFEVFDNISCHEECGVRLQLDVVTYSYELDGILFKQEALSNYKLTDGGFKNG